MGILPDTEFTTRPLLERVIRRVRKWPRRRWIVAAVTAMVTIVVIGVPTDLIDTPLFGREIPPTWWAWPALVVTSVLSGLLLATYVRSPLEQQRQDRPGRFGLVGAMVSFFAVGCPVCNKLVLLAVGTSGALQFFEPIQPLLAVASIGLVGWALTVRIARENACAVPTRTP